MTTPQLLQMSINHTAKHQDNKSKTGGGNDTYFEFHSLSENGKLTAAGFGNFHAGYTGVMAGLSQEVQYQCAGLREAAKFRGFGDFFHRLGEIWKNKMPYEINEQISTTIQTASWMQRKY